MGVRSLQNSLPVYVNLIEQPTIGSATESVKNTKEKRETESRLTALIKVFSYEETSCIWNGKSTGFTTGTKAVFTGILGAEWTIYAALYFITVAVAL